MANRKPRKPASKKSARTPRTDAADRAHVVQSRRIGAIFLPGGTELDEALVDEAVAKLNWLHAVKGLETMDKVGAYIVETFFGGDEKEFGDRGAHHASYRALTRRADLHFSTTFLWRSVKVHEQLGGLAVEIASKLSATHLALLATVASTDERFDLAERAVNEEWTKDQLQAQISASRPSGHDKPKGRPALPMVVKAVRQMDRLWNDIPDAEDVDAGQADEVRAAVANIQKRCEELLKRLSTTA